MFSCVKSKLESNVSDKVLIAPVTSPPGLTAFACPASDLIPKPGYALIFPSNWCYPHAGEPVESGIKRVAVTWYYVNQA